MRFPDIPILSTGPGSQPAEADGADLTCPSMPDSMATYSPPSLPEPEAIQDRAEALARLRRLHALLSAYRIGEPPAVIDLSDLDSPDLELINQTLGEGEVSVVCTGHENARLQETRLAGVWRVRSQGPHGGLLRDTLEVADIPGLVRATAFRRAAEGLDSPQAVPTGVVNAPPLLAELDEQVRAWHPQAEPHVINLTLLPQSDEDLAFLCDRLGEGPVSILSRGYGNCRINATGVRNLWWVRHFNSEDRLILNTLEVVDVPAAALAAGEDLRDSAARLGEILESLQ